VARASRVCGPALQKPASYTKHCTPKLKTLCAESRKCLNVLLTNIPTKIGADLTGAVLSGADLRGADLSHATLIDASLEGCNLSGCNLEGSDLSKANLMKANLINSNLKCAIMASCALPGANLQNTDITNAQISTICKSLNDCNLRNLDIQKSGWDLSGFYLINADMSGCCLMGVKFRGAVVKGCDLTKCAELSLEGCDFTGAILTGTDMSGLNLKGVNFTDANLAGEVDRYGCYVANECKLTGADLRGSNITGLQISSARKDLTGVNLSYLDLTGADFADFDLSDSKLEFCNLTNAKLDRANLMGSVLTGVDFTGAETRDRDPLPKPFLRGLDTRNCKLKSADLRQSNMTLEQVQGADRDLSGANFTGLMEFWDRDWEFRHYGAAEWMRRKGFDTSDCKF
jgi:uncharacterized protein YjbI with pentapeptide repeats